MAHPDRARRAARLSFWLPGLGQLYRRRWWRGLALLATSWWLSDTALAAWPPSAMCACHGPGALCAWSVAVTLALGVWIAAVRDAGRPEGVSPQMSTGFLLSDHGSRCSSSPVSKSSRR
jgi:hypothetical protein